MNKKLQWQKITLFSTTVSKRMAWTFLFIFVYLLGQSIPIGTTPINDIVLQQSEAQTLLRNIATMTGGNLSSLTLFSIGISPWMTSMILWRFVTVFGLMKNMTSSQVHRYRLTLAAALAVLQAYALTLEADFTSQTYFGMANPLVGRLATILVLVTGSFILTWIGNENGRRGLGGMMVIVLTNMMLAFVTNTATYFTTSNFTPEEFWTNIGLFVGIVFFLILLAVITFRAELRIPIRRVAINNAFAKESYLPIRLMPAGAMPFMYGMSLMLLPIYITSILLNYYPYNEMLMYIYQNIGISNVLGAVFYMIMLYILSVGFAYYNYDPYELSKGMRQNGEYIASVLPGRDTQKYLSRKVFILSQIGAFYAMLVGGIPLLIIAGQTDRVSIALLINNAFIVSTLMLGVIEQINTIKMWKKYRDLI